MLLTAEKKRQELSERPCPQRQTWLGVWALPVSMLVATRFWVFHRAEELHVLGFCRGGTWGLLHSDIAQAVNGKTGASPLPHHNKPGGGILTSTSHLGLVGMKAARGSRTESGLAATK